MSSLNMSSLKDKVAQKLKAENQKGVEKKEKKEKKKLQKLKDKKEEKEVKNGDNDKKEKKGLKKVVKKSLKPKEKEPEKSEESPDLLKNEVLALGGSEEDLELVNIDDDEFQNSEDDEILEFGDESGSKDLKKGDLEKFIQLIGLTGEIVEASEEEDEQEEDEQEEEKDVKQDKKEKDTKEKKSQKDQKKEESSEPSSTQSKKKAIAEPQTSKKEQMKKMTTVDSKNFSMPARPDWYNTIDELDLPEQVPPSVPLNSTQINELKARGKALLEEENTKYYEEFTRKSSQKKFFSDILTSGTLNDKISALTLMIQESPLHNVKSLDTLLAFCAKKSRTASLQAVNSLKDLLVNGLLPDLRKLHYFKNQPTLNKNTPEPLLMLYYYEDHLKGQVFKLLEILERLSLDSILHVRMSAVGHIFELLTAKPEQEQNLLALGVNKLGDIEHKVCAKTSFAILQLEQAHPAMKSVILKAVVDFVTKNYTSYNSKYYSVLTLNQTILTKKETELANMLVQSYFVLFKRILNEQKTQKDEQTENVIGNVKGRKPLARKNVKRGKKGGISVKPQEKLENEVKEEQNSKLFSAVLSGLNRAFPFSSLPNEVFAEHLDSLYKIVHSSNFSTTIQALSLIQHIVSSQGLDNLRYYKSLYESLLDERLVNSSKQGLYLNLLYKSLKADTSSERIAAFVKRIMQICLSWMNMGAVSGMLFLLVQLLKHVPAVSGLLSTHEGGELYDLQKRDPRFAGAEKTSLWELVCFLRHFHPSVKLYAEALLEDKEELVKPDLGLFSLSHFLDKFVYKNPKQKSAKGQSIMQPLGGAQTGSLLVKSTTGSVETPVNMKDWFNRRIEDISPDERFFHEFFKNKEPKGKLDVVEEDSDLDEDEVWKALVSSKPDLDEEEISDEGFSDMEDFEMSDDDEEEEEEEEAEEDMDPELAAEFEKELLKVEGGEEEDEEEVEEEEEEEEEGDFTGFSDKEDDEVSESDDESPEMFMDAEDEVDSDEDVELGSKRSKKAETGGKRKKQKVKDLPVFASAEDYAEMLESDEE